MKKVKIVYWISTSLVALMMAYSGIAYLTNPMLDAAFQHLGFPAYFRIELAVAKFIGVAVLIFPASQWLKEWAYAGFSIVFISAIVAHSVSGDPAAAIAMPSIFLAFLLISYFTFRALKQQRHSVSQEITNSQRDREKTAKTVLVG